MVNIAIEGMLLTGAFTGALDRQRVRAARGSGCCAAWRRRLLLGAFLGVLSIRYRVDQIIGGTVINIFALGLTSFLGASVLAEYPDLNRPGSFRSVRHPAASSGCRSSGRCCSTTRSTCTPMFVLVIGLWWALFRTRWGLRVRAVGEHPRAADTVGINVLRTRYRAVILGGAVAGLGGTWFTLDATGGFNENMTAGKGFIALAALDLRSLAPGRCVRRGPGLRLHRGAADAARARSTRRSRPSSC